MASNAARGARAKARTKKWFVAQGYDVADLEKVHYIFTPTGRLPTKRDQLGSDLLAMHADENRIVFCQVKSGTSPASLGYVARPGTDTHFVIDSDDPRILAFVTSEELLAYLARTNARLTGHFFTVVRG